MPKINKILLFIFVVLTIIIIVETGYYFFSQPPAYKQIVSSAADLNRFQAINKNTFNNLSYAVKGVITSSVAENEYRAEIIDIETKETTSPLSKFKANKALKLRGANGKEDAFAFNNDSFAHTKVFNKTSGKNTPMNFDELRVGDKVIIKEKLNLMEDINKATIEIVISKVSDFNNY